jgi:hypothetical protein
VALTGTLDSRGEFNLGSAAFAVTTANNPSEKTIHLDHFM